MMLVQRKTNLNTACSEAFRDGEKSDQIRVKQEVLDAF